LKSFNGVLLVYKFWYN